MKLFGKFGRKIAVLGVLVLGFVMLSGFSSKFAEVVTDSQDFADDFYFFAGDGVVDYSVDGDLTAFLSSLRLDGDVAQDLNSFVAKGMIQGFVGDDARIFAADATVRAEISDDLFLFVSNGTVEDETRVGGAMTVFGNTVYLGGAVAEDLIVRAARVVLAADVAGDADIRAVQIDVVSGARIWGDLVYSAQRAVNFTGVVQGSTTFRAPVDRPDFESGFSAFSGAFFVMKVLGFLIFGWLVLWGLGNAVDRIRASIRKKPGQVFLEGLALVLLLPIVAVLLLVTGVGIPVGIALILSYIALWLVTGILVVAILADWARDTKFVKKWKVSLWFKTFLALLLASLVVAILPGILFFLVAIFALGAGFQLDKKVFAKLRK